MKTDSLTKSTNHPRKKKSSLRRYPPPMSAIKFDLAAKTEYQILLNRHLARNEKARIRMARKRAGLKVGEMDPEIREASVERERQYQAEYRARNREALRLATVSRRMIEYRDAFGEEALAAYLQRQQQRRSNARRRRQSKEPYDSDLCQDEDEDEDNSPDVSDDDDDGSEGFGLSEASEASV
ncbi:hypothetical protein R3P38DRAFT_3177400 [Favolaschia claudopus]|uniref:Uncharacterized protein n=1 Tax=Favolaschia claudopus TaxID=2862362 RepID=A0AAW0CZD0_9AGAR